MRKNHPEGKYGPPQPLLPNVNLACCLAEAHQWCECACDGCPPWQHRVGECSRSCDAGGVPPITNRGYIGRLELAAASLRSGGF